jgi:hypothetical protein
LNTADAEMLSKIEVLADLFGKNLEGQTLEG